MMVNPVKVYIGLGSNVGNKEDTLVAALEAMRQIPKTLVTRVSALYLTDPIGYLEQAPFVNAVAEISTNIEPEQLLDRLQKIESKLGRVRTIHWGPRTIDLDILIYGNQIIESSTLTVPHPRIIERAFVLRPLAELEPELEIDGLPINKCLLRVSEQKISLFKAKWFDKLN